MIRDVLTTPESSVALLYHDIVPKADAERSGVVTEGSWRYKLPPNRFEAHLEQIAASPFEPQTIVNDRIPRSVYLTFDDGGQSALTAAEKLEANGYRGHFFVITGRIGDPGYLTWKEIERLHDAGHVVGSHTVTHANLVKADPETRRRELVDSKWTLEDRLGDCSVISIPKGAYDKVVFDAIESADYDYVFTSEPRRIRLQGRTGRIGRWNIWHNTTAANIEAILHAEPGIVIRVAGRWMVLRSIKRLIGRDRFVRLRDSILRER